MTVIHFPQKAIGTPGDCEAAGIKYGADCARAILAKPNSLALGIVSIFASKAKAVNDGFRAKGVFNDAHERAFEKGFQRGLTSQLNNPEATIVVKGI